jgi:hypothetical protein
LSVWVRVGVLRNVGVCVCVGLVWGDVGRCDGDGGRPALGRAGAGVCSGARGAGVL